MLQIDNTISSRDIFDNYFCCYLDQCKGNCCVEGDVGAPLEIEECTLLENNYEQIKPFMRSEGINAINDQYLFIFDQYEDNIVTPLVNDKECAYVVFENDIASCAIEKAYNAGKITFKKPISCHLYPIRVKQYENFDAINYHEWSICKPACTRGKDEKILLFEFLKEPLIRLYGSEWYEKLVFAGNELNWIKRK